MTRQSPEPHLVAVRKESPPDLIRGRPLAETYADALATLAADPGEWYAILDYGDRIGVAASSASSLRNRVPGYEFVARRGVVYGRCLTDDGADS